jgi:SAM-dependent methyltransferase
VTSQGYDAPAPHCTACAGSDLIRVGPLPLRTREGVFEDTIFKCRSCGTFTRASDFSTPQTRTHFDVSQYTNPENETAYRQSRVPFFDHLIELAERHTGRPAAQCRVLDVGASWGHLIDQYRNRGATCTAIEISERGRAVLLDKNIDTITATDEIPVDAAFDVIMAIDSLYYFQSPEETLRQLRPHLTPDGVMVVRIANRTPLLNLLRLLRIRITEKTFGDVKSNFTFRGFKTMLETAGFRIDTVYLREKGKRVSTPMRRWYYRLSPIASKILGYKLTPGIVLICRRSDS